MIDPLDEIAQSMYGKDLTDCTPDEELIVRVTLDGLKTNTKEA